MTDDTFELIPAAASLGPVPVLLIPRCEKGIGAVIGQPGSDQLIVLLSPLMRNEARQFLMSV